MRVEEWEIWWAIEIVNYKENAIDTAISVTNTEREIIIRIILTVMLRSSYHNEQEVLINNLYTKIYNLEKEEFSNDG